MSRPQNGLLGNFDGFPDGSGPSSVSATERDLVSWSTANVRASFTEQIATIAEGRDRLILEQSGTTLKGKRLDTVMHWVAPVTDGDIDLEHVVVSLADITEHRGRIQHRDSLGNDLTVTSGGMQWLVSGSGALHEEVLNGDENGVFHMAQLWVNLPSDLKMKPPEHHAVPAEQIPDITSLGQRATVRLYAGDLAGETGPAPTPTPVLVAHVTLEPGGGVTIPVPGGWTTAFTIVAGAVTAGGAPLKEGDTPVFNDDGDTITVSSESGGQLLLMCGQPLGEPIAMGGGFVMNTRDEIEGAFDDYRTGRMGELAPSR